MAKVTLDNFLRAEVLEGATKKEPKDGIIKEGNYNIDYGVGVRAISGEKTGFA